jgi:hypothetical protein
VESVVLGVYVSIRWVGDLWAVRVVWSFAGKVGVYDDGTIVVRWTRSKSAFRNSRRNEAAALPVF